MLNPMLNVTIVYIQAIEDKPGSGRWDMFIWDCWGRCVERKVFSTLAEVATKAKEFCLAEISIRWLYGAVYYSKELIRGYLN